jgi:pyruvate/2-oxoacid:ferredoxin oxidoreductase alpha subunit
MSAEVTPESEHSAMAACVGAAAAGARAYTATSGQGLALMHEMLHWAAGARAPSSGQRQPDPRSPRWPDQTDSLAEGRRLIQYYCENGQESHDTTLQAFRVAEQVLLPAMAVHEASTSRIPRRRSRLFCRWSTATPLRPAAPP